MPQQYFHILPLICEEDTVNMPGRQSKWSQSQLSTRIDQFPIIMQQPVLHSQMSMNKALHDQRIQGNKALRLITDSQDGAKNAPMQCSGLLGF